MDNVKEKKQFAEKCSGTLAMPRGKLEKSEESYGQNNDKFRKNYSFIS